MIRSCLTAFLAGLLMTACQVPPGNFDHVRRATHAPPHTEFRSPFTVDVSGFDRFAVVRLAGTKGFESTDPITEEHLLFLARSLLELLGYVFVYDPAESDFIVSISYSNEAGTQHVPPEMVLLPTFSSGNLTTGRYGFSQSTSFSMSGVSGAIRPGYSRNVCRPVISLNGYDKQGKLLFAGMVTDETFEPDLRMVAPWMMISLGTRFPLSKGGVERWKGSVGTGLLGINFFPATMNGNEYYLTVIFVAEGPEIRDGYGNRTQAGPLRRQDVLLEVNGKSTRNLCYAQMSSMIRGDAGETLRVKVKRGDRVFEEKLVFKKRP